MAQHFQKYSQSYPGSSRLRGIDRTAEVQSCTHWPPNHREAFRSSTFSRPRSTYGARLVDTVGADSMQSSSISRLKGLSMKKFIPLVAFLTSFLFPIVTR